MTERPKYLTTKQVAATLGVSSRTIETWRLNGAGPPWVALSTRVIRYEEGPLILWARARSIDPRAK